MAALNNISGKIPMCVYKITHKDSGRSYIGQTRGVAKKRWMAHKHKSNNESCGHIQRAIKKYGIDNFDFEVIDIAETNEQLDHKECFWIEKLNTMNPNGFNLSGGGNKNKTVSEETREKQRQARTGTYGYWNGKSHSEETKILLRSLKLGVPIPENRKKIISGDGLVFESINSASVAIGIPRKYITGVVTGRRKSTCGHTFKYFHGEVS